MKSYFLEGYETFTLKQVAAYIPGLATRMRESPETEVFLLVGGTGMGRAFDFFAICRDKDGLYYVYSNQMYSIRWQRTYVTIEKLRAFIADKVADFTLKQADYDAKSVIYWWRAELKEILDELESEERGRVSQGTVGTVQEA
jgi:hypothetical protein